jgi:tetratricopeptide (TPR) repeat protein
MRLVWNGRTKADYQAQYEEGLGEERCGRPDEAEAKFRSALEGFNHLLSSTHPETVAIAYRLASFFAEHVRMQDADTVLDWLNQAHLEDFGFIHTRTLNHISNVCDMFRNWGRPEQAAELLQRVLHEADKELPGPDSTYPLTASTGQYTNGTSAQRTVNEYEQEHNPQFSIPPEGPVAPSALQAQLSQLTRGSEAGEGAEAVLLRLIKHCEQYPDKLLVHSLLCYPPLLDYYEDRDDVVKKSGTLDRAEQAVWTVLQSKNKKTRDVLVACLQLSKHLVRAARYESADETFSQIECDAQETFGSDHYRTIWFLENIGTFYQNEGRWQDAAPRFEHALAARLSRYGERHESVRRLEDALENHHFETYVPSNDEETFQHAETQRSTCKILAPEVFFLGPRPRGRQME